MSEQHKVNRPHPVPSINTRTQQKSTSKQNTVYQAQAVPQKDNPSNEIILFLRQQSATLEEIRRGVDITKVLCLICFVVSVLVAGLAFLGAFAPTYH